jgi:hypothetical protein
MVVRMTSPALPRLGEPIPAALRWAVRLLLGEAAAVALIAGYLLYEDLTAEVTSLGQALAVTGYALVMAALLALAGINLARRRAWPRGLAVALQLMLVAIAYYMVRGGLAWLGLPVAALGLTVAGLLVSPATREALGIH